MQKMSEIRPDLCVIGLDPAGFEIAFAAAGLRAPVVVIAAPGPEDPAGNAAPLRRLRALGVRVIESDGHFEDKNSIRAGGLVIRARRFVIATGAEEARPVIPGIEALPLWDREAVPAHLLVLGGGAHGAEQAQQARRMGARVTMLAERGLLDDFDPEAAGLLRTQFERDGIALREHIRFEAAVVAQDEGGGQTIRFETGPGPMAFSHLALDCGVMPRLEGLAIERAGVVLRDGRPVLSAALRTSNRRIYVAGPATGIRDASRAVKAQVGAILGEILFRRNGAIDPARQVRLALTSPMIAEIGLAEREIKPGQASRYRFYRASLAQTGRAGLVGQPASHAPSGQIKVIADTSGQIRGVSILATDAAELIAPLALAMVERKPLHTLAALPIATPSHAEAIGALARQALRERLTAPGSIRLMRLLRLFG